MEREILPLVSKPGRYIGGEWGAVTKPSSEVEARIVLAFPDVYEIGMSHLGFKILYALVNENPRLAAERVFAPWPDMEARMRERGIPLYSLETFTPLSRFDIIGFSLQYELTYTNLLTMLDLGGVPPIAARRAGSLLPLVIAGGPGACVPGPLEDFIDVFVIGDGEEALVELLRIVAEWKRAGDGRASAKRDMLIRIAEGVKGTYVPELYRRRYSDGGALIACEAVEAGVPQRVRRRVITKLDSSRWLKKIPVPNIGIVHDRVAFEIRRGCGQGCRFCQAGIIYRPVRDESHDDISEAAREALAVTGYDEIALCALSVGDYPCLETLADGILDSPVTGPVSLSLPSLRPDRMGRLAEKLSGGRKTGITLAPEAGTERLRRGINKKIAVDELIRFVTELRERGWRLVKLYFMIGLPGETEADLMGIVDLIRAVSGIGKRGKGRWDVNVTVSSFIPKAHTPFQWEPMESLEGLRRKQAFLRREARSRNVKLKFHDLESSLLESVFSRGDRKLCKALYLAWERGCRFDSWSETFRGDLWREALEEAGIAPRAYSFRAYADDDYLPWDIINTGVRKSFLLSEREKSKRGEYTPDCAAACLGCGVCADGGAGRRRVASFNRGERE